MGLQEIVLSSIIRGHLWFRDSTDVEGIRIPLAPQRSTYAKAQQAL